MAVLVCTLWQLASRSYASLPAAAAAAEPDSSSTMLQYLSTMLLHSMFFAGMHPLLMLAAQRQSLATLPG
jgi:hypothetical protein